MSLLAAVRHVLPVPRYLCLPSVGVACSDTALKYLRLAPAPVGRGLRPVSWGTARLAPDTLARGTVVDQKKLAAALRAAAKATNTPFARLALPEEQARIFTTTIRSDASFGAIRGLLESRLAEQVEGTPKNAVFDYDIIPDPLLENATRVAVTVYNRDTIVSYSKAARAAGFMPLSFEVEAAATARAVLAPNERGTRLVLDFGKTHASVGVVHQGVLTYTSTIDIGGETLSAALRKALGGQPEPVLTKLKNTVGVTREREHRAVSEAIERVLKRLARELNQRVQHWNTQVGTDINREIDSIVLCGGSANLKGLPTYLETTLNLPTTRARVWQNVCSLNDTVPPISRHYSYGYATAVGLALTGHEPFYD